MTPESLWRRSGWIFDLDGTLTVPMHDFEALRQEMDLPPGPPILEALAQLPAAEATPRRARLFELELELAAQARPQTGARALLSALMERGAQLGLVTRNDRRIALKTLRAIGLDHCFDPACCLGREDAPIKPSPAGVQAILSRWSLAPDQAVMVGDYHFDLQAGRRAGTATVLLGAGQPSWRKWTDLRVERLDALLPTALRRRSRGEST